MVLDHLEPAGVFKFFERLCSVPHGSGNTDAVSSLCQQMAGEYGIWCQRDPVGNIIMKVPGSAGCEGARPILLQGHLDMVCDAAPQCGKDMVKEGLDLREDGIYVWAEGTSLGGDDGIAVAMILAAMTDPDLTHPPIEALFTVDEETGMDGAHAVDFGAFRAETLLNIDSEVEGEFTCGCAGGVRADLKFPRSAVPAAGELLNVSLSGFTGGHSGIEINKGRANAVLTLGRVLHEAYSASRFQLVSLNGGTADNVIPSSACAIISCDSGEEVAEKIRDAFRKLSGELKHSDPNAALEITSASALSPDGFSPEETEKILSFLMVSPFGVQSMCAETPDLVETSLNPGRARTEDGAFTVSYSVRSSVNSKKQMMMEKLETLAALCGAEISFHGSYAPWEYRTDSPIRQLMTEIYRDQYGTSPRITVIHAGLECGLFCEKKPNLDCISFGPNLLNIHTWHEKMDIASVGRVWKMLTTVLERLSRC